MPTRSAASRWPGAAPPAAYVKRGPIRDIEAVAERTRSRVCARDLAALLACRQARAATDPAIRSAMAGIARDETRHAALAWAVDGWSRALLAPSPSPRPRGAARGYRTARWTALGGLPRVDRAQAGLPRRGGAHGRRARRAAGLNRSAIAPIAPALAALISTMNSFTITPAPPQSRSRRPARRPSRGRACAQNAPVRSATVVVTYGHGKMFRKSSSKSKPPFQRLSPGVPRPPARPQPSSIGPARYRTQD